MAARLRSRALQRGEALGTHASVKRNIIKLEQGEILYPRTRLWRELLCEDTGLSHIELFGNTAPERPDLDTFRLVSHKFVPTFVGAEYARDLANADSTHDCVTAHTACSTQQVHYPGADEAALYVYPFGVALFHIVETVEFPTVCALARWRETSYEDALSWAGKYLSRPGRAFASASYVFSVYVLAESIWSADALPTAMRLISMPEVMFGSDPTESNAEAVEAALLRDDFAHPDIVEYGVMGVSIGYASWSSISYYPLVAKRALSANELAEVEVLTQAVWCYCRELLDEVEAGRDPVVPDEYGWRYLRAMKSKALSPGAQESTQRLSMRRAVYETSHLGDQLSSAIECLRHT